MVNPAKEGIRLYGLLYKDYDDNYGASVGGISGSQGSVKTTLCLDLAEKKMENNKDELILWRETFNSPMQCRRIKKYPYKIYVENDMNIVFSTKKKNVDADITYFRNITELYNILETQTLNVIFFNHRKKWTDLIRHCNSKTEWCSVFLDEMEGLYNEGSNNQTDDRWWDWMAQSGEVIKECRKSYTSVFGNYHDENLIDHRVRGKFMYYIYGFGAVVNRSRSRVTQAAVDQCKLGEFYIAQARHRFGKIKIDTFYPAVKDNWIPKII